MDCPRRHGKMGSTPIAYNGDQIISVDYCEQCGGVFMDARAQSVLFTENYLPDHSRIRPLYRMQCPACRGVFRFADTGRVRLRTCPQCEAIWLDAGMLPVMLAQHCPGSLFDANAELSQPLRLRCVDCYTELNEMASLNDTVLGYCCHDCLRRASGLSGLKVQHTEMLTYRGMEIKIDHRLQTTHSRVAVTPIQPAPLDISLVSLTVPQRIARMGYRRLKLKGKISRYYDSDVVVTPDSPISLLLAQKGVVELLYALRQLGHTELCFKPHNFLFEIKPDYVSTEIRLRFEFIVRRLLNIYLNFERYYNKLN